MKITKALDKVGECYITWIILAMIGMLQLGKLAKTFLIAAYDDFMAEEYGYKEHYEDLTL